MGNAAIAALLGTDELDELYRLDASETTPEDEDDKEEDEGEETAEPEGMPHG